MAPRKEIFGLAGLLALAAPDTSLAQKPGAVDAELKAFWHTPENKIPKEILVHGPRESKKVALTFDLCPRSNEHGLDTNAWAVLKEQHEKDPTFVITVFISGAWAAENPEDTWEVIQRPWVTVGNHSYEHRLHTYKETNEEFDAEVLKTEDALNKIRIAHGRPDSFSKIFRYPAGTWSEQTLGELKKVRQTPVLWDVAPGDYNANTTADEMVAATKKARGGSIVALHLNKSNPHLASALPGIIAAARGKERQLVPVTDFIPAK